MTSSLISFKIFNNDFKCIIIQIHEPANTGILVYISCHIEIEYNEYDLYNFLILVTQWVIVFVNALIIVVVVLNFLMFWLL